MRAVRTVLGDVDPSTLGAVYVHEHLIIDNPLIAEELAFIHLPSTDDAVAEVEHCATAGVGCMVDAMPSAGGRHPDRLAEISRRTGVAIVATTGLHTPKYYRHHPWANAAEPSALADLFVGDITDGIDRYDYTGPVVDRSPHRAGIIKVATDEDGMTARALRLFEAAAEAARRTGAPILTHTEAGRGALDQLVVLDELSVPLERVVISHTDKVTDRAYHLDLLASGVYLEYDQALRRVPGRDNETASLTGAMVRAGHVDRIMFGTDGARRTLWSALGGAPGLAWLRSGFVDALMDLDVSTQDITTMFETNPQRFLALEGAAA